MPADVHALSGAYALDALEPEERAQFEAHLAECETCRLDVAVLQQAAASLASTVESAPPAHLRARVLAAAETTPQLPPPARRSDARRPRSARVSRWLVAAAAVVALAGTTYVVSQRDDDRPAVSAASVFGSADARVRSIALKGGQFRVGVSRELGLVAVEEDMPRLPNDEVYQLWVVTDSGARSLGVLEGDEEVTAIPAAGKLAVTAEPEGGSEQPTSDPLFAVDLASL